MRSRKLESGRLVFIDKDGRVADEVKEGSTLRLNVDKLYLLKPASKESLVRVEWLLKTASMLMPRILSLTAGTI